MPAAIIFLVKNKQLAAIGLLLILLAYGAYRLHDFAYTAGVNAERAATAKLIEDSRKAQVAAEAKTKQEVSNVRKTVDDSYRAGSVPERVRRFYIDSPSVPGVPGSVR